METGCDILIIEDSATQVAQLRLLLEREGYTVQVALDGLAGLRLASTMRPRLILLDVELPGLNGLQLCTRLRHQLHTTDIPILLMTAQTTPPSFDPAVLGAHSFLIKGGRWAEIVGMANELLGTSSPSS